MSDQDDICACGCGMTRRFVVADLMRQYSLNEDQADSLFEAEKKGVTVDKADIKLLNAIDEEIYVMTGQYALMDLGAYLPTEAGDAVLKLINGERARAFDQGVRSGSSRAMRMMSDEPGLSLEVHNPYGEG